MSERVYFKDKFAYRISVVNMPVPGGHKVRVRRERKRNSTGYWAIEHADIMLWPEEASLLGELLASGTRTYRIVKGTEICDGPDCGREYRYHSHASTGTNRRVLCNGEVVVIDSENEA